MRRLKSIPATVPFVNETGIAGKRLLPFLPSSSWEKSILVRSNRAEARDIRSCKKLNAKRNILLTKKARTFLKRINF